MTEIDPRTPKAVGCGKCGWGRIVKDGRVTRCSNCGAEEFELSQPDLTHLAKEGE